MMLQIYMHMKQLFDQFPCKRQLFSSLMAQNVSLYPNLTLNKLKPS